MTKILVVEDEPGIAFGLETDLHAEGYDVTLAGDGAEALRRGLSETFDLILLDVMLPHKDGFEVCRELREAGVATPIVMLTAKTSEHDKVLGLDLGADDYVSKPFSLGELRARIRAALRHKPGQPVEAHLQWQLRVAKGVQQRLFPQKHPRLASLDYAAFCQPALEMSGDYFDFLDLGAGKLGLLVVDVVGKGVPAALLMASIHAAVRSRAPLLADRCGDLLSELNTLLYEATDSGTFAAIFYAVYHEATRMLTYSNAGHEPPLLFRAATRDFARLESQTVPVGLLAELRAAQSTVELAPGDRLLICTDGVTETQNDAGEEFGTDRLRTFLGSRQERTAEELRDEVLAALKQHRQGGRQADDVTLITLRVLDNDASRAAHG
jgi:sigma-B regulation protein RsbU (phosphoserine phosphatase)